MRAAPVVTSWPSAPPAGTDAADASRYGFGTAALLFLGYAVLQVFVNGIVLDETLIAAQIITGDVQYDAGHPHAIYYTQAFSLPHYLSALLWLVVPSTELISALRNILFLFLSAFSAYALAAVLTRQRLWGYVAAALVVAESHLRLVGVYPLWTFPNIYSNGHVGLNLSVLIVALVLGRMWRASALLLGLLPGMHAMFALVLWPWALLFGIAHGLHRDPAVRRAVLVWGGVGVAVCAALFLVIGLAGDQRTPIPPYDVVANGDAFREQFRAWTDGHRTLITVHSFGYLVNPFAFFLLGTLLWFRSRTPSAAGTGRAGSSIVSPSSQVLWILLLGGMIWIYIYATRVVQGVTGTLPDFVFMTMPGRFSNLTATLLPPLSAAGLASALASLDPFRRGVMLAVVAALLFLVALGSALPTPIDARTLVSRNLLLIVWGIAVACAWAGATGRARTSTLAALAALLVVLATFRSTTFVVGYVFAAAAFSMILLQAAPLLQRLSGRFRARLEQAPAPLALAPGLLLMFAVALPGRRPDPVTPTVTRWDMQTPETEAIDRWLDAHARPDEPVLVNMVPNSELQVKTMQPVLFEHKTLWIMSYMPDLAPAIGSMTRDLYGVDYSDPRSLQQTCDGKPLGVYCPVWHRAWEQRSVREWRELGRRYRFRLVLAASNVTLDLPVAVSGERWTLYTME